MNPSFAPTRHTENFLCQLPSCTELTAGNMVNQPLAGAGMLWFATACVALGSAWVLALFSGT